jgi:hypothetical protein
MRGKFMPMLVLMDASASSLKNAGSAFSAIECAHVSEPGERCDVEITFTNETCNF